MLFNPKKYASDYPCEKSKEIMLKTIEFFEQKGKKSLKNDDQERVWYYDFVEFLKENQIFATLMTPSGYGAPIPGGTPTATANFPRSRPSTASPTGTPGRSRCWASAPSGTAPTRK